MSLYQFIWDVDDGDDPEYVEADDVVAAVEAWRRRAKLENPSMQCDKLDPDVITVIHGGDVIRDTSDEEPKWKITFKPADPNSSGIFGGRT